MRAARFVAYDLVLVALALAALILAELNFDRPAPPLPECKPMGLAKPAPRPELPPGTGYVLPLMLPFCFDQRCWKI